MHIIYTIHTIYIIHITHIKYTIYIKGIQHMKHIICIIFIAIKNPLLPTKAKQGIEPMTTTPSGTATILAVFPD